MNQRRSIGLSIVAAALFAGSTALAQAPGESADHSAHHPDQQAQQTTPQTQPDPQMMGGCPNMGSMMGQPNPQMMGGCPNMGNMMGQGMQSMMGSGMMGSGTTQSGTPSGMGTLFGSRVTPMMALSVEDVRGYLAVQLNRLNNKRLKLGDIKSDDGNITADVVTIDNSLVQRLRVDRHTGAIEYQN
jgi:hypothetical protein